MTTLKHYHPQLILQKGTQKASHRQGKGLESIGRMGSPRVRCYWPGSPFLRRLVCCPLAQREGYYILFDWLRRSWWEKKLIPVRGRLLRFYKKKIKKKNHLLSSDDKMLRLPTFKTKCIGQRSVSYQGPFHLEHAPSQCQTYNFHFSPLSNLF